MPITNRMANAYMRDLEIEHATMFTVNMENKKTILAAMATIPGILVLKRDNEGPWISCMLVNDPFPTLEEKLPEFRFLSVTNVNEDLAYPDLIQFERPTKPYSGVPFHGDNQTPWDKTPINSMWCDFISPYYKDQQILQYKAYQEGILIALYSVTNVKGMRDDSNVVYYKLLVGMSQWQFLHHCAVLQTASDAVTSDDVMFDANSDSAGEDVKASWNALFGEIPCTVLVC